MGILSKSRNFPTAALRWRMGWVVTTPLSLHEENKGMSFLCSTKPPYVLKITFAVNCLLNKHSKQNKQKTYITMNKTADKPQEAIKTDTLREQLKQVFYEQIPKIPSYLEEMPAEDKVNSLIRMMPYIFPQVEKCEMRAGEGAW